MAATPSSDLYAADAAARRIAQCEFARPLALEAGAGTGKTAILVARLVVWSLGPGWARAEARRSEAPVAAGDDGDLHAIAADLLSRIVAITFTEAAAAEMSRRVGEALSEIVAGGVPVSLEPDLLPADLDERAARAAALFTALEHLSVQTIHAWCRGLLARHPIEASLHPRFEVDADGRGQADVIREVLEAEIHDAYAEDSGSPLFELAVEGFGPVAVEEALTELVARGATSEKFAGSPLSPERVAHYLDDLRGALRALAEAHGGSLGSVSKRSSTTHAALDALATLETMLEAPIGDVASLEALARRAEPHIEACRKPLQRWARELQVGEAKVFEGDPEVFSRCAAALRPRLESLGALQPARLDAAQRALHRLLGAIDERLRAEGIVSYASLLSETGRLLRERSDVCGKLRRELDQLMVDEFQDTDATQCQIVRRIALDGPVSERPSLFLVGDPKQSIYGWRNADLAAYEAFLHEVEEAGGSCERLSVNFRSAPPILDEVERTMQPTMRPVPGLQPAFQPLVPSADHAGDCGFTAGGAPVEHWISWDWDGSAVDPDVRSRRATEIEAAALARDLRRLARDGALAWSDVGILLRSSTELEIYLSALRRAGIPYAVERDRSYYKRREVIEAAALVRCILDPLDHLALLTLLRSSWVGVPDAALVPLWSRRLPELCSQLYGGADETLDALRVAVAEVAANPPEGIPGLERVADWDANLMAALEALAVLRECYDRDAPDRFVERIRALSLVEVSEAGRYLGVFRAANLDRFFRELEDELCDARDAQLLLRKLRFQVREGQEAEEERPKGASDDAVRVMTIHMAKGLDFEHVYLVQLHKEPGGSRSAPVVLGEVDGHWEYRVFGAASLGAERLGERRREVEAAERVRTLYVAMTRAKQRLVLLGKWKPNPTPEAFERCKSHTDLLASREPRIDDLPGRLAEAAAAGGSAGLDEADARWRLPAAETGLSISAGGDRGDRGDGADGDAEAPSGWASTADDAVRDTALLATRIDAAEVRMARPWRGAASKRSASDPREALAERVAAEPSGDATRPIGSQHAAAAGTVIHRILEDLDLSAPIEAALREGGERIPELVGGLVPHADRMVVQARTEELLERILAGSLPSRLASLAGSVVARELPVLLAPDDAADSPVGFTSGTIDLLYRDAETGEWVVADYKTDRVETEADLAERTAGHAAQGEIYTRALRDALGLDRTPRFELWYLWADRVEVPPGAA